MRWSLVILILISLTSQAVELNRGPYRFQAAEHSQESTPPRENPNGYVFDITVQNEHQLAAIFKRAEQMQDQFNEDDHGRITLVLHGQELRLFQKSNYPQSMSIVEKARELDQQNLIDIKACQTAMDFYQIEESELPDFIEQVPLAPLEIERLQAQKGFTRL